MPGRAGLRADLQIDVDPQFGPGRVSDGGAYICLSLTLDLKLNFLASFAVTMVFSVILGLLVERLVLRPLIGEPIISIIMVTIGLTYILRVRHHGVGNDIRQFNIFPETPSICGE